MSPRVRGVRVQGGYGQRGSQTPKEMTVCEVQIELHCMQGGRTTTEQSSRFSSLKPGLLYYEADVSLHRHVKLAPSRSPGTIPTHVCICVCASHVPRCTNLSVSFHCSPLLCTHPQHHRYLLCHLQAFTFPRVLFSWVTNATQTYNSTWANQDQNQFITLYRETTRTFFGHEGCLEHVVCLLKVSPGARARLCIVVVGVSFSLSQAQGMPLVHLHPSTLNETWDLKWNPSLESPNRCTPDYLHTLSIGVMQSNSHSRACARVCVCVLWVTPHCSCNTTSATARQGFHSTVRSALHPKPKKTAHTAIALMTAVGFITAVLPAPM